MGFTAEEILDGKILLFDKEINWTSFDLVKKVKNLLKHQFGLNKFKVGHAGTLDPLASGLLIICTGKATKKISVLQNTTKEYILEIGKTTPSNDLETGINGEFPIEHITRDLFEQTLKQFVGEISQVPPLHSAKWIDGKRAYSFARKGQEIEMQPVTIQIFEIECIEFNLPRVIIRIVCSKGTYIRSLARDIGAALNSGSYLAGLRRTRSGDFRIEDAWDLNTFQNMLKNI